ncbi:MAG: glycosyltransferase [Paludibacteraceae bacterium]|nr:glycosyltransferase [Paludibacteraceae bacterium]
MDISSPKLFVTLYNRTANVDLIKSPGKIPYYISKLSKTAIKSRLVTYAIDNYTFHNDIKDHLEFHPIIPRSSWDNKFLISLLWYIVKNASSIDILHLYHIRYGTLFKAVLYKLFNPKGILYIKLDGEWTLKTCFPDPNTKGIKHIRGYFRRFPIIFRCIVKLSNLISIETQELYRYLLSQKYMPLNTKLFLNPYGIDINELTSYEQPQPIKTKTIITIGRIGTEQKNTDMLLSAITIVGNLNDWQIFIIGPIEQSFKSNINSFFSKNPQFATNVHFTGNIEDRKTLCEYYQKSSCFILTSTFESWGIVLTEAAFYKNYILSTDVGCIRELLTRDCFGSIIPQNDPVSLAEKISSIITGKTILSTNDGNELKQHCIQNFSWESVANNLLFRLQSTQKK